MRIQGYLEIDFKDLSTGELTELSVYLKSRGIDFYRVDTGTSEYYHCLVQNPDILDSILLELASRSPVLQGAWDEYGVPYGKVKNDKTGAIEGEAKYKFGLSKHLEHSHKVKDDGSIENLTTFNPLHQFYGWEPTKEY